MRSIVLGDRPCALCRELTKLHEEIVVTTLAAAVAASRIRSPPRGEYVVIIAEAPDAHAAVVADDDDVTAAPHVARIGLIAGGGGEGRSGHRRDWIGRRAISAPSPLSR